MTDSLVESIVSIVRQGQGWAIPIAFLVAFGESLCFLSIVWPGWAILTALAFLLAASGVGSSVLLWSVVAAGLGGVAGYSVSYWIGLYFKDTIPNVWPFKNNPTLIPRGEAFFEEHGLWSVFLGHFVGPVRAVIPVVAGMFAMPQIPFQIANVASAFIWAIWVILWPVLFVAYQDTIFAFMRDHEWLIAAIMFAVAFAGAIPMASLVIPMMVVFAFIGGLHLYAGGSFLPIFLAGAAGALAADLFFHRAGATSRGELSDAWYINDGGKGVAAARSFLRQNGVLGVITSKALGTRRATVPIAAGVENMPLASFIPLSVVSAALWSAALLVPGLIARAMFAG
ncbi:VTT domain-containing protein [Hyphomicrobium sulfonivorans]|uniref:VTT domain-containing protein n=1 Tax=Hyphomicrobium sulfonivorans TaxID=121290 RepID=UPI00156FED5F|nr:VTT domain-containing protein [Hyphomicrobium sulfonivorans]MBI1650095.1 VTT domain-containing protein [Hyphomicrobium sulfonivorans]NSL73012.1 hypothetical protein [Hyphomicrobium sulfonivorans]